MIADQEERSRGLWHRRHHDVKKRGQARVLSRSTAPAGLWNRGCARFSQSSTAQRLRGTQAMLFDPARRLLRMLALAVLMLGMAGPLQAAQEMPLELRYGLYWGGMRLATPDLHHELAPGGYRSGLSIETVGLVERFAKYRAEVNAVGERHWFGDLIPVTFSSKYKTRKKSRSAVIEFDPLTGDVVG